MLPGTPVVGALDTVEELEGARAVLHARLHARADDLEATTELRAVNAALAELTTNAVDARPSPLQQSGLSAVDRLRSAWRRPGRRS